MQWVEIRGFGGNFFEILVMLIKVVIVQGLGGGGVVFIRWGLYLDIYGREEVRWL